MSRLPAMVAPSAMCTSFSWCTRALKLPPTRAAFVSVRLTPAMVRSRPMLPLTSALPLVKMSTLRPFKTGTTIALPNAACLVTGDLNGDGIPDLLVPAQNAPPAAASTMYAYLGNGDGTFTQKSATALSTPGFIVLADFNGDGKLDFATSGNLLALGNGDGPFQTPAPFVPKVLPATQRDGFDEIAVGDLNGDGWPDLVLTDFWNSYKIGRAHV